MNFIGIDGDEIDGDCGEIDDTQAGRRRSSNPLTPLAAAPCAHHALHLALAGAGRVAPALPTVVTATAVSAAA